ncbi:MAG: response regulator [Desulfotalea sp.]
MKRVLIVDDEEDMLWMLQRNLSKSIPDAEILAASSGEEALSVLSEKSASLVISDINMPGMNGLDLLVEINNIYPETSVIIMTAYPSSAFENEAMMSGALRFIEKPFDIKELKEIVNKILNQNDKFQGTIDGIELIDIVQFNGLSGATAALKVTTIEDEGMIFFQDGQIVHAMCGDKTGEDAFFTILNFQGGSLQNIRGAEAQDRTITKDLQTLLFEVAVQNDEEEEKQNNKHDPAPSFAESPIAGPADTEFLAGSPELRIQEETNSIEEPTIDTLTTQTATEETEEMSMSDIQEILAEFTNIEGVHTACLVGRDGFLLDSLARKGIDAEMIGAIASSGFGSSESMGNQLGQGELNMTMLEYENGPVLFAPVGEDAFLVIVADSETNLGWIRISIKKNAKKIAEAAGL